LPLSVQPCGFDCVPAAKRTDFVRANGVQPDDSGDSPARRIERHPRAKSGTELLGLGQDWH
jgi:hypothetical protein